MGFCRRCGNIVAGERCVCGGTAVAPAMSWSRGSQIKPTTQDRWSKTYTSLEPASSSSTSKSNEDSNKLGCSTSVARRFPRPRPASVAGITLQSRVSDHISNATSKPAQPPSPLKQSSTLPSISADIIPSLNPNEPTLSKVYGSVLQPKDTLPLHSCAICSTIFPPDATIYPNPQAPDSASFLCRNCFATNGGSKGMCPTCSKPVLTLKAEGGFVQANDRYWHKSCFNCAACFKNIGNSPLVDLLGRPSCEDCFDNCLKRDPTTPKRDQGSPAKANSPKQSNPGGINFNYNNRQSREGSPAIEELEQRFKVMGNSALTTSPTVSPRRRTHTSPSHRFSLDLSRLTADVGVRQRLFTERVSEEPGSLGETPATHSTTPPLTASTSPTSETNPSSTSTLRTSVGASSNPSADQTSSTLVPAGMFTPTSQCSKCHDLILKPQEKGHFITVPATDENSPPDVYHVDCFKCAVCDQSLTEVKKGQLGFVRSDAGPCHPECTSKGDVVVRRTINTVPIPKSAPATTTVKVTPSILPSKSNTSLLSSSSRYETPLAPAQSPTKSSFPRFGGHNTCPGCRKAVSPMERGVVPGPQGTKWHASCLICGGRKDTAAAKILGREKKGEPGCGKKLDSAAKIDGDGGVWCRQCLLLIGIGGSPQTSPNRPGLVPSPTGEHPKLAAQLTGMTTIARQFTGSSETLLRQYTGGGLNPTRSISPTKQFGMMGGGAIPGRTTRPRPKSVIGMRSKSIDEGRGMFLLWTFFDLLPTAYALAVDEMSNGFRLLPTSVELSDESALNFVLTDIPLFCQGVMAIGIFTFYFLTKQVKLLSVFLCGASFLAFAAATLDLGQVVTRGRLSLTSNISLDAVTGFIVSREVFLSLSYTFLNLFLWVLVADCPLNERRPASLIKDNQLHTSAPRTHTAAWSQWGIIGYLLRWGCMAAALAAGVLQMLWRLIPQQRTLSTTYVAAATLQSSLTAVFFLKLLLNIYASRLRPWYLSFRSNLAPMMSLMVGLSISIGNLTIFAFSETSLGRFLYAVQVYILMVHNLYSTFHRALVTKGALNSQANAPPQEKPSFKSSSPTLPTFDISSYNRPRAITVDSIPELPRGRPPSVVWTPPRRISIANPNNAPTTGPQFATPDVFKFPPIPEIRQTSPTTMGNRSDTVSVGSPQRFQRPIPAGPEETTKQEAERYTTISLSYYGESPDSPVDMPEAALQQQNSAKDESLSAPSLRSPDASKPTSITSLDAFLQEQDEMDKTIAALRLYPSSSVGASTPAPGATPGEGETIDVSRSLNDSFLSRSGSGRSEFSLLSIFPEPPKPQVVESVTKYAAPDGPNREEEPRPNVEKKEEEQLPSDQDQVTDSPVDEPPLRSGLNTAATRMYISLSALETSRTNATNDRPFASAATTQYDVTSFIGGLTSPSRGPLDSGKVLDDTSSDITTTTTAETATISTAVLRPNPVLRTMILSTIPSSVNSTIEASEGRNSTSPRPVGYVATNATTNSRDPQARLPGVSDNGPVLRPLLIGKPVSELPQQIPTSSSMVPLAQRRKRGGSLTGQGRPVISAPVQRLSDASEKPGAFERPRPPPLRLIPE